VAGFAAGLYKLDNNFLTQNSPFLPEALKEEKVAKAARSEEAFSQIRPKSDIKRRSNSNKNLTGL
jgi:hypothetical protein